MVSDHEKAHALLELQDFDPGFPTWKSTAKRREFLIALSDNAVQVIHYTSRVILSRQEVIPYIFLHKIDKTAPGSSTNPTSLKKRFPSEPHAIIPLNTPDLPP